MKEIKKKMSVTMPLNKGHISSTTKQPKRLHIKYIWPSYNV